MIDQRNQDWFFFLHWRLKHDNWVSKASNFISLLKNRLNIHAFDWIWCCNYKNITFTYKILSYTVYSNINVSSTLPQRKQRTINYKHTTESLLRNDSFILYLLLCLIHIYCMIFLWIRFNRSSNYSEYSSVLPEDWIQPLTWWQYVTLQTQRDWQTSPSVHVG